MREGETPAVERDSDGEEKAENKGHIVSHVTGVGSWLIISLRNSGS